MIFLLIFLGIALVLAVGSLFVEHLGSRPFDGVRGGRDRDHR